MAKKDRPGFVDHQSDESLGAVITNDPNKRQDVHESLFKSDAKWQPRIRLIAPSTKTFGAAVADVIPEQKRVECIPVKGSDKVCALNWPKDKLPMPKLLLDFPKRALSGEAAYMQLKRGKEPETIAVVVFSDQGARSELTLCNVKAVVLDRLFAPIVEQQVVKPLPELPGELPIDVQSAVMP